MKVLKFSSLMIFGLMMTAQHSFAYSNKDCPGLDCYFGPPTKSCSCPDRTGAAVATFNSAFGSRTNASAGVKVPVVHAPLVHAPVVNAVNAAPSIK